MKTMAMIAMRGAVANSTSFGVKGGLLRGQDSSLDNFGRERSISSGRGIRVDDRRVSPIGIGREDGFGIGVGTGIGFGGRRRVSPIRREDAYQSRPGFLPFIDLQTIMKTLYLNLISYII